MSGLGLVAAATLVVACSVTGTWLLRRYALARQLMDIPNARSSHSVATPRGGGVAFVVAYSAALLWLAASGLIERNLLVGLLGAGLLVAAIGFVDDLKHVPARWRLLAHSAAAAWLLAWLGLPVLSIGSLSIELGGGGYIVLGLALVWLLNLFNFMDGIDGLAGIEAITVCLAGVVCYALIGLPLMGLPALLLACAVFGFVVWNWPPAKIFMGDAGSGFLGIILGGLALHAASVDPRLLWCWLILMGVFVLDATWTLVRRLARGDKVYEAHRSHAYQYASREFGAHRPVTLAVLFINLGWLLPWAAVLALGHVDGVSALLMAYLPLAVLAVWFRAGSLEKAG